MICAAILAAGASRRLGQPKQLLSFEGGTLLGAITARVRASACDRVAVVLGCDADLIAPAVASSNVDLLLNADWREGMASSIRRAVTWASSLGSAALVLCAVDQPGLSTAHVDALVRAFQRDGRTAASSYDDALGIPAVFGACWFASLGALTGDRGARALIASADATVIDWPDGALDVDTPDDVERLRGSVGRPPAQAAR